jgi:hypothetical protein
VPATKIMLIRHAERPNKKAKAVNAEGKRDHEELIVRGWQRSGALVRLFAPRHGKFVDPRLAQPKTIFASAVTKDSTSWRPQHTVLALADELKFKLDVRFPKGDERDLAQAAIDAKGPVLNRLGTRGHSKNRECHRRQQKDLPAKMARLTLRLGVGPGSAGARPQMALCTSAANAARRRQRRAGPLPVEKIASKWM